MAENLVVKYKKVVEGVAEIMGGQVIELECVKQWNARLEEGRSLGREEGRSLGKEEGLAALVNTLKTIFDNPIQIYNAVIKNEAYADVTKEQVMKYYQ